ncbi:hypothetical protein Tco_0397615 [Tanacetum coccineum]
MGDEHLSTIPEIESDELIKSSVENLVPIPSEFEGISDDTCDVPVGEDSSTFDALSDHSEILSDSNDDGTSSDDDDFEDIKRDEKWQYPRTHGSGSTTTHANNSLPEYDSFLFEIELDQGGLTSVVILDNSNDHLLELPEFESYHFDPSFPRPLPEPSDFEICLDFEPDSPVINNFDELNEDEYL